MHDLTKTKVFSSEDMRREMIRSNLQTVIDALNERGYKTKRGREYQDQTQAQEHVELL